MRNKYPAPKKNAASASIASTLRRIKNPTPPRYLFTVQSKARLKYPNSHCSSPRASPLGRNSSALSAGLSDNALNAEINTDAAMVSANCL